MPARVYTFGMWLFLIGLVVLFAASMLLYVLLRVQARDQEPLGELRPALMNLRLFASTAIVLLASVTVHLALLNVRRERQRLFMRWLVVTFLLALCFLAVQTPAMIGLLQAQPAAPPWHEALAEGRAPVTQFHRFLFLLVLLHAAHVLGGVIYMAVVLNRALAGYYDHEHYVGVRHAAMYWHFLDLVWLFMFGTFLVLG